MSLEVIRPDWPAPANVHAFVTTRSGGFSSGPWKSMNLGLNSGDDYQSVQRNRALLNGFLPCPPQWLRQVHGTRVIEHPGRLVNKLEADALFSCKPRHVCAVLTADCLPVFLCDVRGQQVAVAHAGWRGLAAGVLQNVIKHLSAEPRDLIAWLGPAIGPNVYEVGSDVKSAFTGEYSQCFSPRDGKWLFDLYAAARIVLVRLGISSIHGGSSCTFSEQENFFSFRRDGITGRMASVIWCTDLTL